MNFSLAKTVLLATSMAAFLIFFSVSNVYAQSISGDGLCGATFDTRCGLSSLQQLTRGLGLLIASLGSAAIVVLILIRVLWSLKLKMEGKDPSAMKEATGKALQALIGFAIVFVVIGGVYLAMLKLFGTQEWTTRLLQLFSFGFIEVAYAQQLLPNPLGSNSAYDIIISGLNLAMKFFIYPSLIVFWVASGFKFVYSQGNPEGLKTARNWLLLTFIVTVLVFTLQGFILAFKGTAQKVFGGAGTSQTTGSQPSGTLDGRGSPASPNSPGASCQVNGQYGVRDIAGNCVVSSRGGTSSDCTNKSEGAACTVSGRAGTCSYNDERVWGCYAAPGGVQNCAAITSEVQRDACFRAQGSSGGGATGTW